MTEKDIIDLLGKVKESRRLLLSAGIADVESLPPSAARLLASETDDLRAEMERLSARTQVATGSSRDAPAAPPTLPIPADVRIALGPGESPRIDLVTAIKFCRERFDGRGRPVVAVHLTQDNRSAWISVPDTPFRESRIHYPSYLAQSPSEAASHARLIALAAAIADPAAAASFGYPPTPAGPSFTLDESKAAELVERALNNTDDPGLPEISPSWDPAEDDGTVQSLITAAQDAGAIAGPGIIDFYRTPEDGQSPGYEWQVRAAAPDGSEIRFTANGGELLYLGAGSRGAPAALAVIREAAEEANAICGAATRIITTHSLPRHGPGAVSMPPAPGLEAGAAACRAAGPEREEPGTCLEP